MKKSLKCIYVVLHWDMYVIAFVLWETPRKPRSLAYQLTVNAIWGTL